jgi:hypothetical protein
MGSSFSRAQAANAKNNASTAILRSALTNYINATKNMNANKIRAALNNKRIGLTESYKNRIANGVANAVIKARKANVAVAAANLGAVSETVAAVHVNNAANKLANLNKYMNTLSGYTNNNNKVSQYKATGRNLNANRALNAGRNGGPKYANFFKLVNTKKAGATKQGPANTGAGGNNNMAIVNRAIATKELSELNSAKLLNAAANKLKNSNNKNLKSNFVNFAKRQINKMNNENNKKKVRSAIMKVSPENNMFKQANNAANKAKRNALLQGQTEQTANNNAAKAAAAAAVAAAPPNANANAVRQAAKAATLAAGATPVAANNASKMVTQNLNEEQKK